MAYQAAPVAAPTAVGGTVSQRQTSGKARPVIGLKRVLDMSLLLIGMEVDMSCC